MTHAVAHIVIAIDPGRSKCGVAAVRKSLAGAAPEVLHQSVVETPDLAAALADLAARFPPDIIVVGNGTASSHITRVVSELQLAPVKLVDEKFTSLLAKKRYFAENPPRGLRGLIPTSLQTPARPYDDYVAVALAERYLLERDI